MRCKCCKRHKQDIEDWRWSEKRHVVNQTGTKMEIRIDGVLHSMTRPAQIGHEGGVWYFKGQPHRDNDLPAVDKWIVKSWYRHGKLHRENDKPAVMWEPSKCGRRTWYRNGLQHRDNDKPSHIEETKLAWMIDGLYHRENGQPALIEKIQGNRPSNARESRCHYQRGQLVYETLGNVGQVSPDWNLYPSNPSAYGFEGGSEQYFFLPSVPSVPLQH